MEFLTYEVIDTMFSVLFSFGILTFMIGMLFVACMKKDKSIRNIVGVVFFIVTAAFVKSLFEAGEYEKAKVEEKHAQMMIEDGWELQEKEGKILTFIKEKN